MYLISKFRSLFNSQNFSYKFYLPHLIYLIIFSALLSANIFVGLSPDNEGPVLREEVLGVKINKPGKNKIATASAAITPSPTATPSAAPTHFVYFGAWTEGLWNDPALTLNPSKLSELQNKIGKKAAIAHFYTGWSNLTNSALISQLNVVKANGWRPMISTNPYFFDRCVSNGKNIYKATMDGDCDGFLADTAKNLKSYGSPVFLRFAWEMNIDSMEWSIQKTGSTPAEYVQAWRRFHDIAVREGATNILWVFSPNIITPTSISYSSLYPGSGYVDWTGLDGYNWGTTQSWSKWESFSTVFRNSYNSLLSVAPGKPMMIAEVNTTDVGGDKSAWYTDALSVQIPNNFPQIKAIVFYNENRSAKEGVNWLIDISPQSLEAFSKFIQNPTYLSNF